ncbi:MAG: ISAs1 family transposase [Nostoc sp.]
MIIESGNDYIAALKGNQQGLFKDVKTNFIPESTCEQINKGHGRVEKRHVSICQTLDNIRPWPGLLTLIQVKSERQVFTHNVIEVTTETRYYISSLCETAQQIAERIRGYWGVENKVHYVRDVTQGEDASRIRTTPLPQIFALARNFSLNLYRDNMFKNMAQAQRLCSFGLDTLKQLFRMK